MKEHKKTLTEQAPDVIESAYWTFKGGTETIGLTDARKLLEVTHTTRISGTDEHRWCVTVYLDVEDDFVPEIIENASDEHDLVEVERENNYDGTLKSVTYTHEEY